MLRGLTALVAAALVLVVVQLARLFGDWTSSSTVGFAVGLTAGMSFAGGIMLATSRPLAFYLAGGDRMVLRRALRSLVPGALAMGLASGVLVGAVAEAAARPDAELMAIGAAGFVIAGTVLSLVGICGLLGRHGRGLIPPVLGLAVFVGLDRFLARHIDSHLLIAAAVGTAVALVGDVSVVGRSLPSAARHRDGQLVRRAVITGERLAYFACGALALVPLLAPQVLVWNGRASGSAAWNHALVGFEIALLVALMPLIVAVGVADRELKRFWYDMPASLEATAIDDLGALDWRLRADLRGARRRYLVTLSIVSVIVIGGYWAVALSGMLDSALGADQIGASIATVVFASVAHVLLGLGTFNSMYALSLGQTRRVMLALLVAGLSVPIVGWPLAAEWSWRAALPSLLLACFLFAVLSRRAQHNAIAHLPRLYSIAS